MLINAFGTATRIALALDRGEGDSALRAFLDYADELERQDVTARFQLASVEPGLTGSPAWDAALAALVDLRLIAPKPPWIESPNRFLASPQTPQLGAYDLPPDLSDVPPEFLRRNILIERRTLQSV
jgi:hypothetical protein